MIYLENQYSVCSLSAHSFHPPSIQWQGSKSCLVSYCMWETTMHISAVSNVHSWPDLAQSLSLRMLSQSVTLYTLSLSSNLHTQIHGAYTAEKENIWDLSQAVLQEPVYLLVSYSCLNWYIYMYIQLLSCQDRDVSPKLVFTWGQPWPEVEKWVPSDCNYFFPNFILLSMPIPIGLNP